MSHQDLLDIDSFHEDLDEDVDKSLNSLYEDGIIKKFQRNDTTYYALNSVPNPPKSIRPLRQTIHGYFYGVEGTPESIYIPFSKIEWFLNQVLRIQTQAESEALCSFAFDYPDGHDIFYAENYPPENDRDHRAYKDSYRKRRMKQFKK